MEDNDLFALITIVAFFVILITVAIVTPTESTRKYEACVKVARDIKDCEPLLINSH